MPQAMTRKADTSEAAGTEAWMRSAAPRLLHVFPGFGIGGVEIRIATMINRLGGRYAHAVVALDGVYDAARRLDGAVPVAFPLADPQPKGDPLRGALVARRHLARLRPGLLLTYNWGSIEWALANRFAPLCRHVHFESGFGSLDEARLARRIALRRLALGRAERIVVPSAQLHDLVTGPWGFAADRVAFVPNGVDLTLFDGDPAPHAAFTREPGELVIGTVTSLRPEKNLARLIRVFGTAMAGRRARLVVVGDGPERPGLEAAARAAGVADRTVFTGFVNDPHRVIRQFDIYAMSSDTEQMPNALVQAMAARLPVASTDVGDIRRIVAEPNRTFVAPAADEAALATALARLADDAGLRAALGRANRARAETHYGLERMAAAYRAIFDGTPLPPGHERPDAP